MSETYTIKEISELFNIPKSTLRYWESEGAISSLRNDLNNYREYSTDNLIQICDIIFYRNLNLPLKQLDKIRNMNISETEELFINSRAKINKQISELESTKSKIEQCLESIKIYNDLNNNPYKKGSPPFNSIVHLHPGQTKNVLHYINDQNVLAFSLRVGEEKIKHYGIVSNDTFDTNCKKLWVADAKRHEYVECLIKTVKEEVDQFYLQKHLDYLKSIGKKPGAIVARYLISDKSCDYFHAWIEVL